MVELNFIILFVGVIALGIIYQKYLEKQSNTISHDEYFELRKYLLSESDLSKTQKPIMWIHVPHEYNSRSWSSFGSRSSMELNQPYLHLTTKSIIKSCDDSFKIVLIDDDSFKKLIPDWSISLSHLGDPILSNVRKLGIAKLIYMYGGMNVPISFLCFKDLIGLYSKGTNMNQNNNGRMFVCENINTNISSTNNMFYPNAQFMGAPKEHNTMKSYIELMTRTISSDCTAQSEFVGDFDKWCKNKINNNQLYLVPGTDVGTKTIEEAPVLVDTLLGTEYIDFYDGIYGIWIPHESILKRTNYEWFARLSPEQIFKSKVILAKHFVNTMAPTISISNQQTDNIYENHNQNQNHNDWVNFWRVPSEAPVWGMKPINIGDNVPIM